MSQVTPITLSDFTVSSVHTTVFNRSLNTFGRNQLCVLQGQERVKSKHRCIQRERISFFLFSLPFTLYRTIFLIFMPLRTVKVTGCLGNCGWTLTLNPGKAAPITHYRNIAKATAERKNCLSCLIRILKLKNALFLPFFPFPAQRRWKDCFEPFRTKVVRPER